MLARVNYIVKNEGLLYLELFNYVYYLLFIIIIIYYYYYILVCTAVTFTFTSDSNRI